jgi:hypothetical protein
MSKRKPYGGLPSRQVREIRAYLEYLSDARELLDEANASAPEEQAAYMAWRNVVVGFDASALDNLARAGFELKERRRTVTALKAGLEVLRRKRTPQKVLHTGPERSFALIGITPDPTRTTKRVRVAGT